MTNLRLVEDRLEEISFPLVTEQPLYVNPEASTQAIMVRELS